MQFDDLKEAIKEDTLAGYMLKDMLKELLMYECLEDGGADCGCLSCMASKLEDELS
jgi:hypothetical protein